MYEIVEEKMIRNITNSVGQRTALSLVHIVCDTAADMPEPLPHWISGSRCDVLENGGSVYLLSSHRTWTNVNFYNQGGEGGGFDPDAYYTKPQTDAKITEKVAEIVADAPEDFNTLKEMSDWIASHEESAAAMNSAIQQNTTAIAGKVDKVAGKGLSTNDYTTEEKTKLADLENYDDAQIYEAINSLGRSIGTLGLTVEEKVDKVSGKGLSTEDYTTAEKTKLAGIASGAEVNVQSDWNQTDSSADDFIKNKPDIPTSIGNIKGDILFKQEFEDAGTTAITTPFPMKDYDIIFMSISNLDTNYGNVTDMIAYPDILTLTLEIDASHKCKATFSHASGVNEVVVTGNMCRYRVIIVGLKF